MTKQLRNLKALMDTFLESKERFLTIYSPLGFDFTLTVEDRVLTVTRDNMDLVIYDASSNQITFDMESDDLYCLTEALIYQLKEWYPDMARVLATFAPN